MGRTNYSSYMAIKRQLVEIFRKEQFPGNKLPPEPELAGRLGVSLVTLRESLLMLALEGYITKKHGSGNYVHPSALDPANRIDLGMSFADAFRHNGYEPGMEIREQWREIIGMEDREILKLPENSALLCNEIVYTADGQPGVYTINKMPEGLLVKPLEKGANNWYIHELVWEYCGKQVTHSLSDYKAVAIEGKAAEVLELTQGTPVLYARQLFYDLQDNPLLYNIHYFHPQRFGIRLLQNWDLNT